MLACVMLRLISIIFIALPLATLAQDRGTVAFFGLTYLDGSIQTEMLGQDPAELERLKSLETLIRTRLGDAGYQMIDTSPVAERLARTPNPAKCNGCDTRMAADLGADFSLVGEVQKVSNLLLSMNLQMRDAASGQMVRGRVVDIRGNTDESWHHGMGYILRHAFDADG